MGDAKAHNLTEQCGWLSEENRTESRVTGHSDLAGCLFMSVIPHGQAAPVLICIFVLMTLFSLLVNGLTLFGLIGSEDLSWEPRFALLRNLTLSDLIQTLTFSPSVIYSLIYRQTMAFGTWCYIQYFTGTVSIFTSLVTITCMALERYLYVCHAIHYLVILTSVRVRLTLGLIWLYAITVSTVNILLLHEGTEQKSDPFTRGLLCEPDMMEQHMGFPRAAAIFRKFVGSFTLLLCLTVYAFSYLRMYRDARNAVIPFNAVNTTARKTVLFYCGMLFLQLLPLQLKVASDALWEVKGTVAMVAPSSSPSENTAMPKAIPTATAVLLHMSLLVMLVVPPCINPLVYGLRNAEMRRAVLNLVRWWMEKGGTCADEVNGIRDVVHPN